MPELRPNSWKVLCFIIRRTLGWNKDAEQISYPELRAGTGIASNSTLSHAIKDLVSLHFVVVAAGDEWEASSYRLNTTLEIDTSATETVTGGSATETVTGAATVSVTGTATVSVGNNKRKGKKLIKKAPSARARATPPPPAQPAEPLPLPEKPEANKPRLANDSYDMPISGNSPSPSSGRPPSRPAPKFKSRHYDHRKTVDGYIPEGKGATAVEVYYEWHTVSEYALTAPNQDDIMRQVTDLPSWRAAVKAWAQAGHNSKNIKGMLDWYHDPNRYAPPERNNQKGTPHETAAKPVADDPYSRYAHIGKPNV